MVRCYRCTTDKPQDAFTQRIDDRHYAMCQTCVTEVLTKRNGTKKERLRHGTTERICYLCRRTLPNASFTRRASGTYYSACKDCNRHVFAHRRRVRLHATEGSFTVAEWQELVRQHDRCPLCQRLWSAIPPPLSGNAVITADHIVPVSRGGTNRIDNIQPLCYACNSRKGVKLMSVLRAPGLAGRTTNPRWGVDPHL